MSSRYIYIYYIYIYIYVCVCVCVCRALRRICDDRIRSQTQRRTLNRQWTNVSSRMPTDTWSKWPRYPLYLPFPSSTTLSPIGRPHILSIYSGALFVMTRGQQGVNVSVCVHLFLCLYTMSLSTCPGRNNINIISDLSISLVSRLPIIKVNDKDKECISMPAYQWFHRLE